MLALGALRAASPRPSTRHGQQSHTDIAGSVHSHGTHPVPRHSGTKHILHATVWGQGPGLRYPSQCVSVMQFRLRDPQAPGGPSYLPRFQEEGHIIDPGSEGSWPLWGQV